MMSKIRLFITEFRKKPEVMHALWLLVVLLGVILLILGTLLFGLFHPRRYLGLFAISASFLLPGLIAIFIRSSWLRGCLHLEKVDPKNPKHFWKAILRNPIFPVILPVLLMAFSWASLLFMLTTQEKVADLKKWTIENVEALILASITPQTVIAYYLLAHHSIYWGLYIAASTGYIGFMVAVGGLKMYDGVIGFFDKWKAQSSPIVTLCCAFIFSLSFGALHYGLSLIKPEEYQGMRGIQDSMYFSITSMTTVGYGDILPIGHLARGLSILEICCGFVMLVVAVSASMTVWMQEHQLKPSTSPMPEIVSVVDPPSAQIKS